MKFHNVATLQLMIRQLEWEAGVQDILDDADSVMRHLDWARTLRQIVEDETQT